MLLIIISLILPQFGNTLDLWKKVSDRIYRIYMDLAQALLGPEQLRSASIEAKASICRTIRFVPFPACPQVERHKNPDNPVNPV